MRKKDVLWPAFSRPQELRTEKAFAPNRPSPRSADAHPTNKKTGNARAGALAQTKKSPTRDGKLGVDFCKKTTPLIKATESFSSPAPRHCRTPPPGESGNRGIGESGNRCRTRARRRRQPRAPGRSAPSAPSGQNNARVKRGRCGQTCAILSSGEAARDHLALLTAD